MATDGVVSRWNEVDYSAGDERLLQSVLLQGSGAGAFGARAGRRPGAGLEVSYSGLVATVQRGGGVILDGATGEPWLFALPASRQVAHVSRPGTGLIRRDLVVARIYDTPGQRELKIEIVEGKESSTPSKPALPARSLEIGTADVPATGAVSFLPNPARTVAAGGVLPVANDVERDALPSPHSGLVVYNEQTKQLESFDGTGWSGGGWRQWSGSGSGFGAGVTFTGRYEQKGKTVRGRFLLTTSANGITGTATFSLPVVPHADYANGETAIGSCFLRDASAASPSRTGGTVAITGSSMFFLADRAAPATVVGNVPWAWAAGDTIAGTIEYEAA